MFQQDGLASGETVSQERRDPRQPDARMLGRVIQCDGAHAVLASYAGFPEDENANLWAIGRLISVNTGQTRTVGLISSIEMPAGIWEIDSHNPIKIHLELVGEVRDDPNTRKPFFDRGITVYPHIGCIAHRIRVRDLASIYEMPDRRTVSVGYLSQDGAIPASVSIDSMLSRHFAIVGTTGVGKSSAVSLLLHKAIEERPDLRVIIFDPHNEFASAFPDKAAIIDHHTLDLPFWLFRLEELCEVLFKGRENVVEEVDLLRDLIPMAKASYKAPSVATRLRRSSDVSNFTADTPVPYRMSDVIRFIDDRIGQLESKQERPALKVLRARIQSAVNDPSYRFMFASRLIDDNIHDSIGRIFRVPHHGRPITCFHMAGLPSEVVNSVCSVISRLAFDLSQWSEGQLKLLVLCEEAHRYMPADQKLGFAPTRHALARIAKEGRKYGCYLGVVTQRPGELDPTILSQCSTVFAMRLANERDQEIIRAAIADSSASTLAFLSSLGQREAIAFGEGVSTPMRLKFEILPKERIPGLNGNLEPGDERGTGEVDLSAIVDRIRSVPREEVTDVEEAAEIDPSFFGEPSGLMKRTPAAALGVDRRIGEPGHPQRRFGEASYRPVGK